MCANGVIHPEQLAPFGNSSALSTCTASWLRQSWWSHFICRAQLQIPHVTSGSEKFSWSYERENKWDANSPSALGSRLNCSGIWQLKVPGLEWSSGWYSTTERRSSRQLMNEPSVSYALILAHRENSSTMLLWMQGATVIACHPRPVFWNANHRDNMYRWKLVLSHLQEFLTLGNYAECCTQYEVGVNLTMTKRSRM